MASDVDVERTLIHDLDGRAITQASARGRGFSRRGPGIEDLKYNVRYEASKIAWRAS